MTAPQTPTPGVPLSAENVKLLKAGDVLRCIASRYDWRGPKLGDVVSVRDRVARDSWASIPLPGCDFRNDPIRFTFIGRPDAEGEVWAPISWASAWAVSLSGKVRGPSGRILSASPAAKRGGYPTVRIGNPKRTRHVHTIVAETYLGPRPAGMHVAHQDGNPLNNHADNLRYVTPRENHLQKQDHGTQAMGEAHHCAKLTEEDVRAIRREGGKPGPWARRLGVSRATVRDVINGKTWRSVDV